MNTTVQASKSPHMLMWIAGIAVILFSAAGIAAIMGWIPASMGQSSDRTEVAAPARLSADTGNAGAPKTHAMPAQHPAPVQAADRTPSRARCAECGVVESTRKVTSKGAVGGAVAGNEVEKRVKSTNAYEVTVRLDNGSSRVINEESSSGWHAGDRVKIVSGEIQANP